LAPLVGSLFEQAAAASATATSSAVEMKDRFIGMPGAYHSVIAPGL
jgi:hypothetical protein